MPSDFNNRMDAQRTFLKEVNSRTWQGEALAALSDAAIQRWIVSNRLDLSDRLVLLVKQAGEALYFLANQSQEQITDEYRQHSADFDRILNAVRDETSA